MMGALSGKKRISNLPWREPERMLALSYPVLEDSYGTRADSGSGIRPTGGPLGGRRVFFSSRGHVCLLGGAHSRCANQAGAEPRRARGGLTGNGERGVGVHES